jgi:uncharacterized membrane protein YhaH (DUF805 family)
MNFFDSVVSAFKNYFNFSGRASRSEFWWFFLFCILLYLLAFSLAFEELEQTLAGVKLQEGDPAELIQVFISSRIGIAFLTTFIPQITLSVRRLHDINKSGWWYVGLQIAPGLLPSIFIFDLISVFALFLFIFFMSQEGSEDNLYGPNPLNREL